MRAPEVYARQADHLPAWLRPTTLLILMTVAMEVAFAAWMALFTNFAHQAAEFDGSQIGWMQTIREIPGFLAFAAVYALLVLREQTLAYVSLLLLAVGVLMTGWLPTFWGLALTTTLSSLGFHYFETINQSLQLQWLPKERAPLFIGWIRSAASGTAFAVYVLLFLFGYSLAREQAPGAEDTFDFVPAYVVFGALGAALTLFCVIAYPRFKGPTAQRREMVLRRRYWLYYALVFMEGARRQIFMVFAVLMMVEKFGYHVHEVLGLLLLNHAVSFVAAPLVGRMIARFGERAALTLEYAGLIAVFSAYAVVENATVAAALYVIDHIFFAMAFATRTYFQKIADPADHAPTAAVAFTINHIAAVFLPATLGYLWLVSPGAVFWMGVAMACASLVLARLVPRTPEPGAETIPAVMALTGPVNGPLASRPAE